MNHPTIHAVDSSAAPSTKKKEHQEGSSSSTTGVPHFFRLNEARALAVSVANLTGETADLVLRVRAWVGEWIRVSGVCVGVVDGGDGDGVRGWMHTVSMVADGVRFGLGVA